MKTRSALSFRLNTDNLASTLAYYGEEKPGEVFALFGTGGRELPVNGDRIVDHDNSGPFGVPTGETE